MLLKCDCTQCATPLEFESDYIGTVITCPTCGRPTKLTLSSNPLTENSKTVCPSNRFAETNGAPFTTLQTLRAATCYPSLRRLINILQIVAFVFAALTAIGTCYQVFMIYKAASQMGATAQMIIPLAGLFLVELFFTTACIIAAIFGKQAMHMFVDIADCQIQTVARQK